MVKRRSKVVAEAEEEIVKPRGFDRGLELEEIISAANLGKTPLTLQFLVRWQGCDELDLIPAPEMNERLPERVIAYYEGLSSIHKNFEQREKQRIAMALRPVIVSKVEQIMQAESVTSEELFRAVVQEATTEEGDEMPEEEEASTMVQIPVDMPLIQQEEINWAADEHEANL